VLKHYGTAEEPTSHRSRGSRESTPTETNTLFIELPEEVQNVVRPYLDSKFQLQGSTLLAPGIVIRPDMTFRRWLTSWMRQLTGLHASGPHAAQVLCVSSYHVVLLISASSLSVTWRVKVPVVNWAD